MPNFEPINASPAPDRLAWLARLNAALSAWAAGLSWWRMIALALITLIAGNIIADRFQLSHRTKREVRQVSVSVDTDAKAPPSPATPCKPRHVVIGGKTAIVITEQGCTPTIPATPASAASAASDQEAPIKIEIPKSIEDEDPPEPDEEISVSTQHTLGGWIGDVLSALLVAFFAYLVAAKIIVRKTAESDAKLQVANSAAEREAMQRQLVQARLKLLQAQVEPHFLFNTLAAVDYLIETDAKRASEMQKLLISYLRAALPQMRQESSTLGRELALIRPYLELLKLRIEERMSYEIAVPLGLESTIFPPMVLQTLVENAIKHGIEPKPEGGHVTVSAQVVDGQLRVEVADTGVGLHGGHIYAANTAGTGLGLDNIRNRLALLYPGTSSLDLHAGNPVGTVASLAIPYQVESTRQK
jgi:hypothetical protein